MTITSSGVGFDSGDHRVAFDAALPWVQLSADHDPRAGHRETRVLRPTVLRPVGQGWIAGTDDDVHVELVDRTMSEAAIGTGPVPRLGGRVVNGTGAPVRLARLSLLATHLVRVGEDPRRWRTYRNGYQSWAGTWTIGTDESDRDVPTRFGRNGVTDGRHPSPSGRGHVRSDSLGVIAEPHSVDALGLGFTTLTDAFAFVEIIAPGGMVESLDCWVDLDDTLLGPGDATPWFEIVVLAGGRGDAVLRDLARITGDASAARRDPDGHHPAGWCSWYYYFTKVTEADVAANLAVLAEDGTRGPVFGAEYAMVDDGHQRAIGDWLDTNEKFPSGMRQVAADITSAGFDAGLWWAPFIASSRSKVAAEHPDWFVRGDRGRPVLALLNPGWGLTTPMWALDTTRPEVLDHIEEVAATITHSWGYRIQKIDFCYAAALRGRRHDRAATRAQALRRGLEAVRRGAGEDAFVLGCGCPLGPAVGIVDAMRIGADVTPSWDTGIARTVGRGRHALSTRNALLNTLTRAALDGAWFANDPDCLMVRDTDTTLALDEVRLMCTVFGMTDGMIVLSDDLTALSDERRALVARARSLAGGRCEVVDLFDRTFPEVLLSRHDDHVDVALVNLSDRPRPGVVDLARLDVTPPDSGIALHEYWTAEQVVLHGPLLDLGNVAPHSARVARLPR
ncbi:MAG: alpha-galactosidase [Microthrixaceae bacterium]